MLNTFDFYSLLRRDSNILLPKTPSMKRKRQESQSEHSSDDCTADGNEGIKAFKTQTQGNASPLIVIKEEKLLDGSFMSEGAKIQENGGKRTTRASRASTQAKRQLPKRGARNKNSSVVDIVKEEEPNSPSVDALPKRSTRNSRKKNCEIIKGNNQPKRITRNTQKVIEEAHDVSNTEDEPLQPVTKKRKSSNLVKELDANYSEDVPVVSVKQEPLSPVEEVQTQSRSLRSSLSAQSGETENKTEILPSTAVPETLDPSVANVTGNVASPTVTVHRAAVHLVLQSPRLGNGKDKGATPVTTSSPCIEEQKESLHDKVQESEKLPNPEEADSAVVASGPTLPVPVHPDKSQENCKDKQIETQKVIDCQEKLDQNEDLFAIVKDSEEADGKTSKDFVKEDTSSSVHHSKLESTRKSMSRSSGWKRRSKRLSHCLSPTDRRLSLKKTVTKTSSRKSIVKSSIKLKLTNSKLMPELKLTGTTQNKNGRQVALSEKDMEDVRVRLFDDCTSNSSDSANSAVCHSSTSSSEGMANPLAADGQVEEVVEDVDGQEVFHDCMAENEVDLVANDFEEHAAKINRYFNSYVKHHMKCPSKF